MPDYSRTPPPDLPLEAYGLTATQVWVHVGLLFVMVVISIIALLVA